ncbi:MAG: nucleoside-diphosphate kinase [Sphaerochaetaceae bacterium]|nr:nucleoside-diphosphate kinase [Sphaerochaetaceae bacterium]
MDYELSYVLVSPYTVAKGRIGGVLSRLLTQVDLELVGAQLIAPDNEFAQEYAHILSLQGKGALSEASKLLQNYVLNNIAPTGKRAHRTLLLLFRGTNACRKLSDICGALYAENRGVESLTGETIRDTYADLIKDDQTGEVTYFEPAVLTPRKPEYANRALRLLARWLPSQPNIVHNVTYPESENIERSLVILKPDNWNFASSRPGAIIDMFSRTGMRIVGVKVHRMSVSQALEFYKPVKKALQQRLAEPIGKQARQLLESKFSIHLSEKAERKIIESVGKEYAEDQFEQIVEFMSGTKSGECPVEQLDQSGSVKCMMMVYEGESAVSKIRDVLGPTDPTKAPGGTVRREFGSNIMANTAHASASVKNAEREIEVVDFDRNSCSEIINAYITLWDEDHR